MKSLILTSLLTLLLYQLVVAQTASDADIRYIREQFKKINEQAGTTAPKTFTIDEGEGGEVSIYTADSRMVKVTATFYGETGKLIEDYYFDDQGLIFVFVQEFSYNRPIYYDKEVAKKNEDDEWFDESKTEVEENRYYFKNEQLIRWLDPDKKEISSDHPQYPQKYMEYWEKVYQLVEMSDSVIGEH